MRGPHISRLLVIDGIFLLIGLILLFAFPNWIIQKICAKVMYLHEDSTGKSSFTTDYWERLPAVYYFQFYLFNITNPNEVMFYGHDAIIEERGPYTYAVIERKQDMKYLDDGNKLFYRTNKTWAFDQQRSCPTCFCSDKVALPNLVYTALLYMKRTMPMPKLYKFILDVFMIVMKIQPVRNVKVCELLLDSYKDPTLEFINTPFFRTLKEIFQLQTPDFADIGYFPKYNKTSDGDFVIKTGKDDIKNIAQLVSWNNWTELPWWNTKQAREIVEVGDGINQTPGIGKNDKYEMFQSLACRKFSLKYSGHEGHLNGIPSLGFSLEKDTYDGVSNIGYRYENLEKANYFPDWPCGPNHTVEITERCLNINCDEFENWCDKCCNANFINQTYVLPPGIIPLRCQPARTTIAPISAFLSAPHFLWSPNVVKTSLKGINPNPVLHDPGMFHLNSLSGHTVSANFRVQFNVPLYPNTGSHLWSNVQTKIIPAVWIDLDVEVLDYALNFFYLMVVVSQQIVFIIAISCFVFCGLLSAFIIYKAIFQKHVSKGIQLKKPSEPTSTETINATSRL